MAEGYLKPRTSQGVKGRQQMENGMFRNPPSYTELGGFSTSAKYTDPSGRRQKISGMSLERGGPSAQRGKPI
jgi:hypothetical protein